MSPNSAGGGALNETAARWWLYMIQGKDGRLYIGIAKDVLARFAEHEAGRGALFTRLLRPLNLIGAMPIGTYSAARALERRMKRLPRGDKLRWAASLNLSEVPPGADGKGTYSIAREH